MNSQHISQFCSLLKRLPSQMLWEDEADLNLYALGLQDIPDTDAPALLKRILSTCTFRPTVAEILELHRALTTPALPSPAELAALARRCAIEYGKASWPPVAVLPAEVRQAIRAVWGDWYDYCLDEQPAEARAHRLEQALRQRRDGSTPLPGRERLALTRGEESDAC